MLIAGDLRNEINVKRLSSVKDAYGSITETYTTIYALRAGIKFNSGTKSINNDEIFNSQSIIVTCYFRNILTTDRVEFNSKMYKILFINPIGFKEGLQISIELIND